MPIYPDGVRRGQEAWVRVNFAIDTDGAVADPIIVDSSGGAPFESSVLEAIAAWRFTAGEAAGASNNSIDIRFELTNNRELASSDFLRRYRNMARNLLMDKVDKARDQVQQTSEFGGWNLYESTMLHLMIGRVDGAEGQIAGNLAQYRRALGIGNSDALSSKSRREIMTRIFEIEFETGQYAAAVDTWTLLAAEPDSQDILAGLADKKDQIDARLADAAPIAAQATLTTPCDRDAGEALWSYVPARRGFSFASVDGNVERFEARCDNHRIGAKVEPDKAWSLPESWGRCQVFVFGDDGASFEFVELPPDEGEAADAALAVNHVLDQRDTDR